MDDGSLGVNEVKVCLTSKDETSLHWTLSDNVDGEVELVNLVPEMKKGVR